MSDDWRQIRVPPQTAIVVLLAVIILIVVMAASDGRRSEPSSTVAAAAPAAPQLGSGNRHAHLQRLVAGLAPLFTRYEEVGPASVNLYLDVSGWNDMTHDQQQQLMDELASKQIVRDIGATLHLYVNSTEVGTIGPGWTGEWAFRR